jgi:hypothetical protein
MTEKIYTGIGSRETPEEICNLIRSISKYLYEKGWKVRSGGADGADKHFEFPVKDIKLKEIYLPWRGFNGNHSPLCRVSKQAMELTLLYYPYCWEIAKLTTKFIMGRNAYQVLGRTLNKPSKFIICYTTDGCFSGGTGQALRIAKHYRIPIYNLHDPEIRKEIFEIIDKLDEK